MNGFTCECAQGWTGPLCDVDVLECSSDPCLNNGECHERNNGYTCNCLPDLFAGEKSVVFFPIGRGCLGKSLWSQFLDGEIYKIRWKMYGCRAVCVLKEIFTFLRKSVPSKMLTYLRLNVSFIFNVQKPDCSQELKRC